MSSPQFSERSSSMVEMETCVPPGFRFHPTEEELVGYYLKRKINSLKINLEVIVELDLYKMEPWDIQDRCKLGYEEQNEWYFFSHKDKKYPTGTRTNRATAAGFWKATGRDKAVMSKNRIIGMRKTLVFYQGRAPNGRKSDWIMHEYRLQTSEHAPPQEEGWVVCRAFRKPSPNQNHIRQSLEAECYLREQIRHNSRPFSSSSFGDHILNNHTHHHHHHNLIQNNNNLSPLETLIGGLEQHQQLIEVLPQLESPNHQNNNITSHHHHHLVNVNGCFSTSNNNEECFSDVESLDNLFASNLCTDGSTNAFFSHSSSSSNMIINNNMPQYHHQLVQPQNHQPNVHVLGCFPDH